MKTLTTIDLIVSNAEAARKLGIFGKSHDEKLSNTLDYIDSKKEESDKAWKEYFASVGINVNNNF